MEVALVLPGSDPVHGVNRVGTVPAATTALAALTKFAPDLLLNAGTAGGFAYQGGAIGDVYLCTSLRLRVTCEFVCLHVIHLNSLTCRELQEARLVLGYINADFCIQILIFQHFSRSARSTFLCTAPHSEFCKFYQIVVQLSFKIRSVLLCFK